MLTKAIEAVHILREQHGLDIRDDQIEKYAQLLVYQTCWSPPNPDVLNYMFGINLCHDAVVEDMDRLGVPNLPYTERLLYMVDNDLTYSAQFMENCNVK